MTNLDKGEFYDILFEFMAEYCILKDFRNVWSNICFENKVTNIPHEKGELDYIKTKNVINKMIDKELVDDINFRMLCEANR